MANNGPHRQRNPLQVLWDFLRGQAVQWALAQVTNPIALVTATIVAGVSAYFRHFEWWAIILLCSVILCCLVVGLNNWHQLVTARSADHKLQVQHPTYNNVASLDPRAKQQAVVGVVLKNAADFPIWMSVTRIESTIGNSSLTARERAESNKRFANPYFLDAGQGMTIWDGYLALPADIDNTDIEGHVEFEATYWRIGGPPHNIKRRFMLIWSTRPNVQPWTWFYGDNHADT